MATTARRDLAHVLAGLDRHQEAIETAQAARVAYNESGAVGEAQRLDDFIESLR